MFPRYLIETLVALAVLAADQATKAWVVAAIAPYQVVEIIPGLFNLVNTRNRGAAFGFLNGADIEWSFWLFAAAVALAVLVILHLTRRAPARAILFVGFGAVLGGAVGNLADRIRLRAVVDFLDFHVGAWHWPAFNVADAAICVGAAIALVALWRKNPGPPPSPRDRRRLSAYSKAAGHGD